MTYEHVQYRVGVAKVRLGSFSLHVRSARSRFHPSGISSLFVNCLSCTPASYCSRFVVLHDKVDTFSFFELFVNPLL